MYTLKDHLVRDVSPWDCSIDKRLGIILGGGVKKNIVYIYEKADTSTFRYRVYNMCQSLENSKKYRGTYFFEHELNILENYLQHIDLVIFVRTRWSEKLDHFFYILKRRKIITLFDVDDLVISLKDLPILMNTLNVDTSREENCSHWFAYVSRLWLMGSMCDGYIGTNNFLRNKLYDIFRKKTYVINNFLNNEQLQLSAKLLTEKRRTCSNSPFLIGYFSGSPSHTNDFKIIAPEIQILLDHYQDIQVEVVGFMDFPDELQRYIQQGRIKYHNLVDFLTLQKKIARVDVNIVPLLDNEFTNCKSELKYFESAIVGTPTCATPTYTYAKSIVSGTNGFLCRGDEWYQTIRYLYNRRNSDEINTLVKSAIDQCMDQYTPKQQMENIETAFDDIIH